MRQVKTTGRSTTARWTVEVGTSYELLVGLYRAVQATRGLPPADEGFAIPPSQHRAADWIFRGDIALGVNLIPLIHERGWLTVSALRRGVAALEPHELAQAMLTSPESTRQGQARRRRQVAGALARGGADPDLLESLEKELFDADVAAALLRNPRAAAEMFGDLLRACGDVSRPHERSMRAGLVARARRAEALVDSTGPVEAATRLCPGWRRTDLARFREIVFVPSGAVTPFIVTRTTRYERAIVVFPGDDEREPSEADLVEALKAVADRQRLEILRRAMAGPVTGHELARILRLTEATTHHHTSLLRAAGLLTSVRTGNRVYHSSRPELVERLFRWTSQSIRIVDDG
jgi:DNA-binding transcriptional ArsR family regulator